MRKSVMVAMIVLMVLVAVSPVWAMGRGPGRWRPEPVDRVREPLPGSQYFTLVGIVDSLDSAESRVTVTVDSGNRFVKPYIDQELKVQLEANTLYGAWTSSGCVEATLAEVEPDDAVSIHGSVSEGVFTAERVTVGVPLDCCTR